MKFFNIEHRDYRKEANMNDFHSHSFYELYYLLSGDRDYYIGSEIFHITEGTLVAIAPYVPHKTEGSVYNRYLISFEKDYLSSSDLELLGNIINRKVLVFDKATSIILENLLNEMIIENRNKLDYYEDIITSELTKLFSLALRSGKAIEESRLIRDNNIKSEIIIKVINYINNNLSEKLTVEILSEKFFISKSHLSRKFKQIIKQNISKYILISRLNMAIKLIKSTTSSMQQIAEEVGFLSSNYMNSVFRKNLNISPLKYRTNMTVR